VAKTAKRPATYEDLLKVPDHLVAEIVEGELFTSPRPGLPHSRAASILNGRLITRFDDSDPDGPGGWWFLFEPELHLDADILVPDIAAWRRERVSVLPRTPAFDVVPDWICEVVSPSTGRLDRIRKLPAYARFGVGHAWLVDPEQESLEVFRLMDGRWTLVSVHEGDDVVRAEPFEAIELPLSLLWLPPEPPA
jgi:Uma2 family endonuclease